MPVGLERAWRLVVRAGLVTVQVWRSRPPQDDFDGYTFEVRISGWVHRTWPQEWQSAIPAFAGGQMSSSRGTEGRSKPARPTTSKVPDETNLAWEFI